MSLLAFCGSAVVVVARVPRRALWYLDKGPVSGSRMNGTLVRPAVRSLGRVVGRPEEGVEVLVLPLPLLPSIS